MTTEKLGVEVERVRFLSAFPYLVGVPRSDNGGYLDRYDNALWRGWLAAKQDAKGVDGEIHR